MKTKFEAFLIYTTVMVFFIGVVVAAIYWEIYRWHSFQEAFHNNIGFWK